MLKQRDIKAGIRALQKLRKDTPAHSKAGYPKRKLLDTKIKTLEKCVGENRKRVIELHADVLKGLFDRPSDLFMSAQDEVFSWVLEIKDPTPKG